MSYGTCLNRCFAMTIAAGHALMGPDQREPSVLMASRRKRRRRERVAAVAVEAISALRVTLTELTPVGIPVASPAVVRPAPRIALPKIGLLRFGLTESRMAFRTVQLVVGCVKREPGQSVQACIDGCLGPAKLRMFRRVADGAGIVQWRIPLRGSRLEKRLLVR